CLLSQMQCRRVGTSQRARAEKDQEPDNLVGGSRSSATRSNCRRMPSEVEVWLRGTASCCLHRSNGQSGPIKIVRSHNQRDEILRKRPFLSRIRALSRNDTSFVTAA